MAPGTKPTEHATIRVGPAGWSYPDWSGYVYPPRRKGFHEATYLAEFFDTIEINTSFYNPIRAHHAKLWLDRVAANPRFIFTAKLWQRFTHDVFASATDSPTTTQNAVASPKTARAAIFTPKATASASASSTLASPSAEDERAVREGFDVLRDAGKLGAVLLQFPFSFHRTRETVAHLT